MTYYVFTTEEEATTGERRIVENVRNWVATNVPAALSEDGTKLKGRNAATGELVNVYTERWAIPQQTTTGQWVFPKPTQEQAAPIPLSAFIAGIDASEAEHDTTWFEQQI